MSIDTRLVCKIHQIVDVESVQHFIEECTLYEDIRERLRTRLFYNCEIKDFSAKTFFEVSKDNPL